MNDVDATPADLITVLTIAQDEEANLERCLGSVAPLGLPHLLIDGGSRDGTVELAQQLGATVLHRDFVDTAGQYNFGIASATTPWVFVLDADEALDDDLVASLRNFRGTEPGVTAYRCRRRNRFVDRWIGSGAWYPDYNLRLLRCDAVSYELRAVHSRVVTSGRVGVIGGHILHHTYTSVSHYLRKLDSYTTMEVSARAQPLQAGVEGKARVRAVWLRLPFKPLTRFLVDYVVRRGFRDGRVGLDVAVSSAYYEYVVGMKQRYGAAADRMDEPEDDDR